MGINEALEEAAVQRVRAVLLTSITTVAGLTPLLFETLPAGTIFNSDGNRDCVWVDVFDVVDLISDPIHAFAV